MAQPIITQVTLSQLNTLIAGSATTWNNNYWGTQFYVTDKEWLLHAHKDNICKPVSGRLTITNGDTLPAGIEPDVLLVDTGVITADISEDGTPINITMPLNYAPSFAMIKGIGVIGEVAISILSNSVSIYNTGKFSFSAGFVGYYLNDDVNPVYFSATNVGANCTSIQAVIEFHKSPFPV